MSNPLNDELERVRQYNRTHGHSVADPPVRSTVQPPDPKPTPEEVERFQQEWGNRGGAGAPQRSSPDPYPVEVPPPTSQDPPVPPPSSPVDIGGFLGIDLRESPGAVMADTGEVFPMVEEEYRNVHAFCLRVMLRAMNAKFTSLRETLGIAEEEIIPIPKRRPEGGPGEEKVPPMREAQAEKAVQKGQKGKGRKA